MKKKSKPLVFNWRYKEYALEAVPKRLVRYTSDEENETVNFVKYMDDSKDCPLKYSIGYFIYDDKENEWILSFVGDRFNDIVIADLPAVWEGLKSAYLVLTEWKKLQSEDV